VQKQLLSTIKSRYEKDVSSLNGDNKKYISQIFKDRFEYIRERLESNEIITDPQVHNYLQQIVKEILQKNAALAETNALRIYFSRAWWANASSLGEGTILFNIGLFHRLQNEAQVAFVLCHELAHYYLDHGNKNILQYVQTVYSDDFQKQLKSISKTEYNRNAEIEKLALNLGFRNRRHSRADEKSADSMAIVLMQNTGYDLGEALSCLNILDASEKEKYYTPLMLEDVFNSTAYPFKKRWLESNSLSFGETEEEKEKRKVLADSLKTHPDCAVRIERIKNMLKENKQGKKFIVDEKKFGSLQYLFDYEILDYLYSSDRVSKCLYTALQMLQLETNNAYVIGMIGKCWNKIYAAQKNHELGKIVDLPGPDVDEEYNKLLRMIQNLRLTEIASVNYHFLEARAEKCKQSEEFVAALIKSKELNDKPEEKQQWINYYHSQFPKRKFSF